MSIALERKGLLSIAGLVAFGLTFSLVACDDSSSASGDDVPGSSGSVPAGMEGLPDDVLAVYSDSPSMRRISS